MSSSQMVSILDYPFEDFTRDFDAVNGKLNAQEDVDMMDSMMIVRDYVRKTYALEPDQVGRGAALSMCFSFLSRYMFEFDAARLAIHGGTGSVFSEPLFRGLYEVVAAFALDPSRPEPSVQEVLRRSAAHRTAT